jgi:uncharacterized membrane protein
MTQATLMKAKGVIAVAILVVMQAAAQIGKLPPSGPMAGFAKYEFNKWLFRACAPDATDATEATAKRVAEALPFIDATPSGTLFRAIQQRWQQSLDPLRGVYVEFSGHTETGRVTVTELHRALGWVESCAKRPTNIGTAVILWAAGHEPSWVFSYDGKTGRLQVLGEEPLDIAPVALQRGDRVLAIAAQSNSARIRIEFSTELCSDTMSEAAFGRSVVVAARNRLYNGCGFVR